MLRSREPQNRPVIPEDTAIRPPEAEPQTRGAPADGLASLDPTERQQTLLDLQRDFGNAYVQRVLATELGPQPLLDPTADRMSRAFGRGFDDVRVRAESPDLTGSTLAATEGRDISIAPGQYQPGTASGDWLLAHELSHVAQQTGAGATAMVTDPSTTRGALEADADRAADAAVAGQPARVFLAAPEGTHQAYEAWEHRDLGDAGGGSNRQVVLPNGISLTYGQIVALSGDFYRSPEALMNANKEELEQVLARMNIEADQAHASPAGHPSDDKVNENNAAYELATTGHTRNGPAGGGPEHMEQADGVAPPPADASFLDLAQQNAAHFAPDNIKNNYRPMHQLALDKAREAWQARHPDTAAAPTGAGIVPSARDNTAPADGSAPAPAPGASPAPAPGASPAPAPGASPAPAPDASPAPAPGASPATAPGASPAAAPAADPRVVDATSTAAGDALEAQAWVFDGFGGHFLTDAFAAGHLISGSVGRTVGEAFYAAHEDAIFSAMTACTLADTGLTLGAETVVAMELLLRSRVPSLTLKVVHDYLNDNGVWVKNALGTEWHTVGDGNLASSPETRTQAELATTASREAIDEVLATGGSPRAFEALNYIPDVARIGDAAYRPIAEFAVDASMFDSILSATILSTDPASNELYKLVKGNILPMLSTWTQQGTRAVGNAAESAWNWVGDQAHGAVQGVSDFFGNADREIRKLYGAP